MSLDKTDLITECTKFLNEKELIEFTADLVKKKSFPPDFNERDIALIVAEKFTE